MATFSYILAIFTGSFDSNGTIKGDDCNVWVPAWNSETHGATDLDMSLAGECYKELPDPSLLSSADFSSAMQDKCGSDYCYCCGAVVVSRPASDNVAAAESLC